MGYLKSCLIAFSALIIFCTSCGDEDITLTTTESISPDLFNEIFTEEVKGHVIDENNKAIEGAIITINGSETATDVNGYFSMQDVFINEIGSLVTIENEGFYTGYKLVYPPEAGSSFVKVQLLEKTLSATFNASEGFRSNFANDANVTFVENSIQTSSGEPYDDEVHLFVHWYSPDDPALPLTMPGDLRAISLDNRLVQLASYGMMAVEIETPSGQSLELMPDKTAFLQFPVPSELLSNAPAAIPTWSFDESTGSWIEEGEAGLDGAFYYAEVSHFSFWNCDAPFPVVELTGQFLYEGNIPFDNYVVRIEVENDAAIARSGWTNAEGVFKGKVPQDQNLIIELINDCNEVIHTQNLSPITEATDLGAILVSTIPKAITVTGSIVDCDSNPIPDGYVIISGGEFNTIDFFTEDGNFTKIVNVCNESSMSIKGFDIENLKESEEVILDASQNNSTVDVGALAVCDIQIEYFMKFQIDTQDEVFILNPSLTSIENDYNLSALMRADSTDFSQQIDIRLDNIDLGMQTPNRVTINVFNADFSGYLNCSSDCDIVVDITTSSARVVEGTFSGNIDAVESNDPGLKMITGSFTISNN